MGDCVVAARQLATGIELTTSLIWRLAHHHPSFRLTAAPEKGATGKEGLHKAVNSAVKETTKGKSGWRRDARDENERRINLLRNAMLYDMKKPGAPVTFHAEDDSSHDVEAGRPLTLASSEAVITQLVKTGGSVRSLGHGNWEERTRQPHQGPRLGSEAPLTMTGDLLEDALQIPLYSHHFSQLDAEEPVGDILDVVTGEPLSVERVLAALLTERGRFFVLGHTPPLQAVGVLSAFVDTRHAEEQQALKSAGVSGAPSAFGPRAEGLSGLTAALGVAKPSGEGASVAPQPSKTGRRASVPREDVSAVCLDRGVQDLRKATVLAPFLGLAALYR